MASDDDDDKRAVRFMEYGRRAADLLRSMEYDFLTVAADWQSAGQPTEKPTPRRQTLEVQLVYDERTLRTLVTASVHVLDHACPWGAAIMVRHMDFILAGMADKAVKYGWEAFGVDDEGGCEHDDGE